MTNILTYSVRIKVQNISWFPTVITILFFSDMTEKDGKRQNMVEALEHEIDLCLESERPLEPSDFR